MEELIYQTSPIITLATNIFINVPVILKFENDNLIEVVDEVGLGYAAEIPIYHSDGTYLAKVKGTRMYPTEEGKQVGVKMEKWENLWVCKMGTQTLFEIHHATAESFKIYAELYTPNGYFVKCTDTPTPELLDPNSQGLKVQDNYISGTTFKNCNVGIWIKQNGQLIIGS